MCHKHASKYTKSYTHKCTQSVLFRTLPWLQISFSHWNRSYAIQDRQKNQFEVIFPSIRLKRNENRLSIDELRILACLKVVRLRYTEIKPKRRITVLLLYSIYDAVLRFMRCWKWACKMCKFMHFKWNALLLRYVDNFTSYVKQLIWNWRQYV